METQTAEPTSRVVPMRLVPISDAEAMKANGVHFDTVEKARWAFRHRDRNGLAPIFRRVGGRVFIDTVKYHEVIDALSA